MCLSETITYWTLFTLWSQFNLYAYHLVYGQSALKNCELFIICKWYNLLMVYYIITDCFTLCWWRIYSIFIYSHIFWIIRFTYIDFYIEYSAALFDIFSKFICTLLSFGLAILPLVHVFFLQLSGYPQEGSPVYCEQPKLNQWALWHHLLDIFFFCGWTWQYL